MMERISYVRYDDETILEKINEIVDKVNSIEDELRKLQA